MVVLFTLHSAQLSRHQQVSKLFSRSFATKWVSIENENFNLENSLFGFLCSYFQIIIPVTISFLTRIYFIVIQYFTDNIALNLFLKFISFTDISSPVKSAYDFSCHNMKRPHILPNSNHRNQSLQHHQIKRQSLLNDIRIRIHWTIYHFDCSSLAIVNKYKQHMKMFSTSQCNGLGRLFGDKRFDKLHGYEIYCLIFVYRTQYSRFCSMYLELSSLFLPRAA